VGVSKLFNQLGTLCSLTGGRATEDKSKLGVSKDLLDLLLLLMGCSVVFVCVLIAHSICACLFVYFKYFHSSIIVTNAHCTNIKLKPKI